MCCQFIGDGINWLAVFTDWYTNYCCPIVLHFCKWHDLPAQEVHPSNNVLGYPQVLMKLEHTWISRLFACLQTQDGLCNRSGRRLLQSLKFITFKEMVRGLNTSDETIKIYVDDLSNELWNKVNNEMFKRGIAYLGM